MSCKQSKHWWTLVISAAVGGTVFYLYQCYRKLPAKTKFDTYAENTLPKHVHKRSVAANYLFTPIKIGSMLLRNRAIKSATYESASFEGKVTDALIQFHVEQATDVAMTTVSYGCTSFEGRTFPHQLLLVPENADGLKKLTNAIHTKTGACVTIQLTHAGLMAEPISDPYTHKYAETNAAKHQILSVSRTWSWAAFQFSTKMSIAQIKDKINQFAQAALLCKQCGFDAITLHCGHGYLISQFLSLITNHRNDAYGSQSIETRCKFAADIVKRIRVLCGDHFPIFIKINSHDGVGVENGGMTVDESIQMCQILLKHGANVIIPTAGFILQNGIFMMRGHVPIFRMAIESISWIKKIGIALVGPWLIPHVEFRAMFLFETSLKLLNGIMNSKYDKSANVCYLGGITSMKDINKAFEHGFELVSIGRALLREPLFLHKIKHDTQYVSQCDHKNRCIIGQMSGKPLQCYERKNCNEDIEDL